MTRAEGSRQCSERRQAQVVGEARDEVARAGEGTVGGGKEHIPVHQNRRRMLNAATQK